MNRTRKRCERLQNERIAAFKEYHQDVTTGEYPAEEHMVGIEDKEFKAFVKTLGKTK